MHLQTTVEPPDTGISSRYISRGEDKAFYEKQGKMDQRIGCTQIYSRIISMHF